MSKIYPAAYMVRVQEEPGDPDLSPFTTHYVEKAEAEYLKRIHGDMAGITPLYSSPPERIYTGERDACAYGMCAIAKSLTNTDAFALYDHGYRKVTP